MPLPFLTHLAHAEDAWLHLLMALIPLGVAVVVLRVGLRRNRS